LLLFGAATADAQVPSPAPTSGAYQRLSAGNQKVARALFEAQKLPAPSTTTTGAGKTRTASAGDTPAGKPLTLDQIAALKQNGSGWEHVLTQMRARGLVTDRSVAQVVTRHSHASRPTGTVTAAGDAPPADGARITQTMRPSAALAGSAR
jgi:hypothetical protein